MRTMTSVAHLYRRPVFNFIDCRLGKQFSTTRRVLTQEFQQEGIPGSNLPFDISCKIKLTSMFTLFFGTGMTAPFLLARRQLLLNSTPADDSVQQTTITVCEEVDARPPPASSASSSCSSSSSSHSSSAVCQPVQKPC